MSAEELQRPAPSTQATLVAPPAEAKVWRIGTLTYTAGGLAILFCWLLWGDFAWSMKERSIASVVQLMLKQMGASDMIAGLLIGSLPSAVTMLLGPVVSYRSDRHRSRWGRRIPYLFATTPIAVFSMAGLAFSPHLAQWAHAVLGEFSPGVFPVSMLIFGSFWTIFEIATVTANAVFTGLINDVVPAAFLGRFYGCFRALSLIAGMVFNYWMLGKAESYSAAIFIGVALLYGVGFTMMCFKVKEGEYPLVPMKAEKALHGSHRRFTGAVQEYFRECFGSRYYLWVFLGLTASTLAFVPVNLFSVFFAKSLGIDMQVYGSYIALTFFISLLFSYPLGWLADRVHPLRASLGLLVFYCIAALWGGFAIDGKERFAIFFVAHSVLSGSFFTCSASLAQRLFPHSRFTQFASAAGFLTAFGSMLLGPALGGYLDHTGHVYKQTYLASGLLAFIALVVLGVVHQSWVALGGAKNYVAPE